MADLSLKGLDDGLMKRVKMRAIGAGMTMRDCVIEILEMAVLNDNVRATEVGRSGFHSSPQGKNVFREPQKQTREQEGVRTERDGGNADERATPKATAIKRMTTEQFLELSNSDKLKAQREGRY